MAGGPNWFLDRKSDGDNAYTVGTGASVQHWRREEVTFQISQQIPEEAVDLGRGDKGKVSGSMTCIVGAHKLVTRQLGDDAAFLCMEDDSEAMERPTGFFKRTQIWKYVGSDERYNPRTGAAIT